MRDKTHITELQKQLIKKMIENTPQIPYFPGDRGDGFLPKFYEDKRNFSIQNLKKEIDDFINEVNSDPVIAASIGGFPVPKEVSMEAYETLKKEGYNINYYGESLGIVHLVVTVNKPIG